MLGRRRFGAGQPTEEEWHGYTFGSRLVGHPVNCRLVDIIGQTHHVVADIDHHGALDGWCLRTWSALGGRSRVHG